MLLRKILFIDEISNQGERMNDESIKKMLAKWLFQEKKKDVSLLKSYSKINLHQLKSLM